jgi:hypothetical protein
MTRLFVTRKIVLLAGCLVLALFVVALASTVKTTHRLQSRNQKDKDALLKQVDELPEQPLRVAGNTDCPFRIIQATVKEMPGPDFSRLTGRTTDLPAVASVPEVSLLNTSAKTITGFVILIRDPQSRTSRGLVDLKASVAPGETLLVKREYFVGPEKSMVAGENGQVNQRLVQPKMDAAKYWLPFAGRSDMFITVAIVNFDDGSSWKVKEGGEVK